MKRNPRFLLATALSILAVSVGILGLNGCATTEQSAAGDEQVFVCPECKIVTETIERPGLGGYDDYYNVGLDPDPGVYSGTQTISKHTCPGCQGVIETLFKEGNWKHKCSVCKDSPFTCPVFHPRGT